MGVSSSGVLVFVFFLYLCTCIECDNDFFLYEGKCHESCPPGTRENGDKCENCNENCAKCEESKDICETCNDKFFLYEGKCHETCPPDTRENGDKVKNIYEKVRDFSTHEIKIVNVITLYEEI